MNKGNGPKGTWLFGMGSEYQKGPLNFFLKTASDYPGVASFRITHRRMHILSDPNYIKQVLVTNNKNYRKGLKYNELKYFLGESLATGEGDFWIKQRRMAQPSFGKKKVASFASTMLNFTAAKISDWEDNSKIEIDVLEEMQVLILDIFGKTLFSKNLSGEFKNIGKDLKRAMDFVNSRIQRTFNKPIWLPTPSHIKFNQSKKRLDTFFYNIIDERLNSSTEHNDLLSMLMNTYDEDTGEKMTRIQLRNEISTILIGGLETTALSLGWTMYLISQNKEIEKKLCNEVDLVAKGNEIRVEDIHKLGYVMQAVKESLRLYPPFWALARRAKGKDLIGNTQINKGDSILISPFVMGRNPLYWKNPKEFNPDRFSPKNITAIDKNVYIPFGGGPRKCIGSNFALMEMQIIISKIYQKYVLEPVGNSGKEIKTTISLYPKDGLNFKLKKR